LSRQKIPLIKPYITQEVKDKVCEVLESGYLTEGPVTKEFEEAFRTYVECSTPCLTSCTTGLEMALRVMIIGPGDEVSFPITLTRQQPMLLPSLVLIQ
jgi:dTDP-4-amino-4,6-dideoxygalactose transaminase